MINVFDSWRHERAIRKTHRQLNQLSDHLLADIGIDRSDIGLVGRNTRLLRERAGR